MGKRTKVYSEPEESFEGKFLFCLKCSELKMLEEEQVSEDDMMCVLSLL